MGPVTPFIPALAGIGGSIFGAITGKKAGQEAMQPSAEERGYLGRQGQLSDMLKGQAQTTFGTGMPGINSAMSYYDTMARGDRAKMSQAIAPSVAQITQQYRGAEGSIDRNLRGAQRQQQKGELSRDRASRLALLTTGQQPGAYDKLNQTGQALIGHSAGAAMGAGSLMNTMLENAAARRRYGMDTGKEVSQGKGKMMSDIFKDIKWPKGGKAPGPGDITPEDTGYDPQGAPDTHGIRPSAPYSIPGSLEFGLPGGSSPGMMPSGPGGSSIQPGGSANSGQAWFGTPGTGTPLGGGGAEASSPGGPGASSGYWPNAPGNIFTPGWMLRQTPPLPRPR